MSKNKVQFEKEYSLAKFLTDYGTQEQCQQALFQWKRAASFYCPQCCTLTSTRSIRVSCISTSAMTTKPFTVNTFFASTKLLLTTWFLAIYLLTQSKNGVSALSLMRQACLSYNTSCMVIGSSQPAIYNPLLKNFIFGSIAILRTTID